MLERRATLADGDERRLEPVFRQASSEGSTVPMSSPATMNVRALDHFHGFAWGATFVKLTATHLPFCFCMT
jgi:hypothetical protein